MGTQTVRHGCEKSTDHCMRDVRKYRKIPCHSLNGSSDRVNSDLQFLWG